MKADFIVGASVLAFIVILIQNNPELKQKTVDQISSINLFKAPHNNRVECLEYVRSHSGNIDKMNVGMFSCSQKYPEQSSDSESDSRNLNMKTSSCVLDNFSSIVDDTSGTKVVTSCAESTKNIRFGIAISQLFSPSYRMNEAITEAQTARNLKRSDALNLDRRPITMHINGQLVICHKIGELLECN